MANDLVLIAPSLLIVAEAKVSSCSEHDMENVWSQFYLSMDITTRVMTAAERFNHPTYPLVAFNMAIMKHRARHP